LELGALIAEARHETPLPRTLHIFSGGDASLSSEKNPVAEAFFAGSFDRFD
jgi:hypothetical protein